MNAVSYMAIAIIAGALAVAFSRRFLAVGALLVANLAVFLLAEFGPTSTGFLGADPFSRAGQVPYYSVIRGDLALWSPNLLHGAPLGVLQLVTSMFVHMDFMHLLGNMMFLYLFGVPFEERVGPRRFLVIYLVAGVLGTAAQLLWDRGAPVHSMGASGAIAGIIGAFAMRYPNTIVPVPLMFIIVPTRVVFGAAAFVLEQLFYVFYALGPGGEVSRVGYLAHLGGLMAGAALALLVLKRPATGPGRTAVDLDAFAAFARDPPTRTVLAAMRQNHDEPAVFQAWLDRFFRSATCPTCGHRVMPQHTGEVVCTQGHKFSVRKQAGLAAPA